jgi:hypothetical protein
MLYSLAALTVKSGCSSIAGLELRNRKLFLAAPARRESCLLNMGQLFRGSLASHLSERFTGYMLPSVGRAHTLFEIVLGV